MEVLERFSRFKDAPWFKFGDEEPENVIIGGAGGIGSWLALFLERAGIKTFIYDDDTIESHNIGGQFFKHNDIGAKKVEALYYNIRDFADTNPGIFREKYTSQSLSNKFMFSAFDNMEARKIMFENWRRFNQNEPNAIFIDGRLEMEQLQIFCITNETASVYEENYLLDDAQIADTMCTLKQTTHTAAMIASLMVGFFTNHLTNIYEEELMRDVPFYYEYFIPLNLTTIRNG